MHKLQFFNVAPSLPNELEFLETLSHNMWWCWNSHAIELFRRIDRDLWKESGHTPFIFFSKLPQKRLAQLVKDKGFMTHYNEVRKTFQSEVVPESQNHHSDCTAYFSLEFGIHESVRLYSGGLGILAGDHLKSASDLHVPLVAVGLFYRHGYFQQYLNQDGWQQEAYLENAIHNLPLRKALDDNGSPVQVAVPLPEGILKAHVWQLDVGNVPLFLLDPTLVENPPEFQRICAHLYDSDREIRLRQELLLGIGGFHALNALGYNPKVYHMNEGHAAFLSLARIGHMVQEENIPELDAIELVSRTNVFTTHTPVPAGNETFGSDILKPHLDALERKLLVDPAMVMEWGQAPGEQADHNELSMTILALRTSHFANGVSKLHGRVARQMWSHLWPKHPKDEIPITSITNGIHVPSWLSTELSELYDRYIDPEWRTKPLTDDMLERVRAIPDDDIWRARAFGRSRLVRTARECGETQMCARNASHDELSHIKSVLHHDILTIGFARRFASYKRATLLLRDRERLIRLLSNEDMPVQIVFAGKAHPADDIGKSFIKEIIEFARQPIARHRIIFIENYDIKLARHMVQGVDVWLNTPRRPQEASGTSGMKACVNGALHLSVLDGWWDEGYSPECGWAIGKGDEDGDTCGDHEYQDTIESQALYNILENEIVPMFYNRGENDMPSAWIKMIKESIHMSLKTFTSHRMMSEYQRKMYEPALAAGNDLWANGRNKANELVGQRKRLSMLWKHVSIEAPEADRDVLALHSGDRFNVTTTVELGELRPDEVDVEFYYGPINSVDQVTESRLIVMSMVEKIGDGRYLYRQEIDCEMTGRYGMTGRVKPRGTEWKALVPGFIKWANGATS